jgi:hypothetical protein
MRMLTRTFRIPPEYDTFLQDESEKHGLTVSAFLNQIIRQYSMFSRFAERLPAIRISYHTFASMLEIIPDKNLIELAQKTGALMPEEGLLQFGKTLDFDSVNWFIESIYGKYGNWFEVFSSLVAGKERLHLTHQLNHKWSQFLAAYLQSMFESILDMEPTIETRPNSVTLYLNPPKESVLKRKYKPKK